MKYSFHWKKVEGIFEPQCSTDLVSSQGIDVISCLLTDSGGLPRENSIQWIDNCLDHIKQIKQGLIGFYSWDRETWSVDIDCKEATTYSLFDEDYSVKLDIESFEEILINWKAFLLKGPPEAQ